MADSGETYSNEVVSCPKRVSYPNMPILLRPGSRWSCRLMVNEPPPLVKALKDKHFILAGMRNDIERAYQQIPDIGSDENLPGQILLFLDESAKVLETLEPVLPTEKEELKQLYSIVCGAIDKARDIDRKLRLTFKDKWTDVYFTK